MSLRYKSPSSTAAPAAVVVVAVAALIARPSESLTLLSPPFLQSAALKRKEM